ncbi:aminopeptidase YwaD [Abditibacteriota bacterium]|nr:aminopeptidase YwaD [Abditibacteriota bacterium]
MRTSILGFIISCGLLPVASFAQGTTPTTAPTSIPTPVTVPSVSADVIARIRDEGMNHSKVMSTLQTLCERFGPRLTGSPAAGRANEWTRDEMVRYGMTAHLESWGPFGRSWELQKFTAQVSAPLVFPVTAFAKAWSPSTSGELNAQVVIFNPQGPADYIKARGKLRGKIVLVSSLRPLTPEFEPRATRRTPEELQKLATAKAGTAAPFVFPPTPTPGPPAPTSIPVPTPTATATPVPTIAPQTPTGSGPRPPAPDGPRPDFLARLQQQAKRLNFLRDEGAALLIDNSGNGSGGVVFTMSASVAQIVPKSLPAPVRGERPSLPPRIAAQDEAAKGRVLPQMTMETEDYNRLYRMVLSGQKVRMRAQITTKMKPNAPCYNTVGEMRGSDLKDQVVMMGAHMDSWQAGTGATDNGAGCAVVMEAARILRAAGLQPRRTIRVALWTGEEEGLLGSEAYVRQHFGRVDGNRDKRTFVPGPEYDRLSAYYNLDNGAGRTRGIYAQSNTAAAPYFTSWMAPFTDLGGSTVSLANTGSTDHISFDRIGLPGFQFIQDNLDYFTLTHHSSQDVVDRVPEEDLKQAAVMMATTTYQTAMMDERFPRKPFTP